MSEGCGGNDTGQLGVPTFESGHVSGEEFEDAWMCEPNPTSRVTPDPDTDDAEGPQPPLGPRHQKQECAQSEEDDGGEGSRG